MSKVLQFYLNSRKHNDSVNKENLSSKINYFQSPLLMCSGYRGLGIRLFDLHEDLTTGGCSYRLELLHSIDSPVTRTLHFENRRKHFHKELIPLIQYNSLNPDQGSIGSVRQRIKPTLKR